MAAMAGLAATYPRFESRRINVFMMRLGMPWASKGVPAVAKVGLQVLRKRPRKPVAGIAPETTVATERSELWAYDDV